MAGKRPNMLTTERKRTIVKALELGNYAEHAAQIAGISGRTLRAWLARGRAEEERLERGDPPTAEEAPFLQLMREARIAEGKAETKLLKSLTKAAGDDWRAAAWKLERRWPQRWSQRVNVVVEEELQRFFDVLKAELPRNVYRQILEVGERASERGHA